MATTSTKTAPVTTPVYPLKDILNANPLWLRRNLGNLEALKASLIANGAMLPALLTPDLRVLDGGRRLQAAKELGWETFPVLFARVWADVVKYFELRASVEFSPHPLTWEETIDLYQALQASYSDVRSKQMSERRRATVAAKAAGKEPPKFRNHLGQTTYMRAASGVIGVDFEDIRLMMDSYAAARKVRERWGEAGQEVADWLLAEAEESGASISGTHLLLRKLGRGTLTPEKAKEIARNPQRRTPVRRRRSTEETRPVVGQPKPVADLNFARRLVEVVEQLGQQTKNFGSVSDTIDREDAGALSRRLQLAITNIHRLRRYLDNQAGNNTGESAT